MKRALVAAFVTLAFQGCVSVVGTVTHPEPYVGVKLSAEAIVERDWPTRIFCLLDFPGTAMLDTLLLPYTAIAAYELESSR